MLRDRWTFKFTAKRLAEAARAKKRHHEERLEFWEDAKARVMAEVRETGIEVSESEAANYSNMTRGVGPQVLVRTDLQRRLTECHSKLLEHDRKIREYGGWVQVLEGNPDAHLDLNADDYLYFFDRATTKA